MDNSFHHTLPFRCASSHKTSHWQTYAIVQQLVQCIYTLRVPLLPCSIHYCNSFSVNQGAVRAAQNVRLGELRLSLIKILVWVSEGEGCIQRHQDMHAQGKQHADSPRQTAALTHHKGKSILVRFVPAVCLKWTPQYLLRRRWWSPSPVSYLSMAFPFVVGIKRNGVKVFLLRCCRQERTLSLPLQRTWGEVQRNFGLVFSVDRELLLDSSLHRRAAQSDAAAAEQTLPHSPLLLLSRSLSPTSTPAVATHWRHYHPHVRRLLRHYRARRTMQQALQNLRSGLFRFFKSFSSCFMFPELSHVTALMLNSVCESSSKSRDFSTSVSLTHPCIPTVSSLFIFGWGPGFALSTLNTSLQWLDIDLSSNWRHIYKPDKFLLCFYLCR